MHYQCPNCDRKAKTIKELKKSGCECKSQPISFLDSEDKQKEKNKEYTFSLKINDSQSTIQILDHKIKVLRPQTFLPEKNKNMILVYLPIKEEITKGQGNRETKTDSFSNYAFFAISKPKNSIGLQREILPIQHQDLTNKFKIDVLPNWNDVRWEISDLKSWLKESKPSDPSKLYYLLDKTRRRYLELANEAEYVKSNLWDIGTYCFELFDAYPYNDYTGTKRAGKSKSLLFQKLVCFNPIMSADITGSATFRLIEGLGATILLDETEQFKNQRNDQAQQVRTLLLQGFTKDQIAVRSEGKEKGGFTPTPYNLYSPKSMAHINAFDDVLEERCIQQINKRALDPKIRNTWPTEKDDSFQKIRNLCYRLFLDYADEIYNLQDEARSLLSISGRELQLWTPIITLALFFERHGMPGLVNKIKESVKQSSEDRQIQDEQESRDLRVLKFVYEEGISLAKDDNIIKGNPAGWIPITALNEHLRSNADRYEINTDYFTRHTFSETLRRLGFRQDRKEAGISWLITKDTVDEVKQRMGFDVSEDQSKGDLTLTSFTTASTVSENLGTNSAESAELLANQPKSKTTATSGTFETKTEQTEVSEHNTRDIQHSEAKTEVLNMAEHNETTAKYSQVQPRMCKCSCGALFHENYAANKVKFKDYHEGQGHKVEFVTEDINNV